MRWWRGVVGALVLSTGIGLSAVTSITSVASAQTPTVGESFTEVAADDAYSQRHADVFRLYWAALAREPDAEGARYWAWQADRCAGLDEIAWLFINSPEFELRYGALDDRGYLQRIYQNVLGRDPDQEGYDYWIDLMDRGLLRREGILLYFSLSEEFRNQVPLPSDTRVDRPCDPTTPAPPPPVAAPTPGTPTPGTPTPGTPTPGTPTPGTPLPNDGSTPEQAAAMGEEWTHAAASSRFRGTFLSLVEVPRSPFAPQANGRCVALLGEYTPTQIDGPALHAFFDTPSVGLLAGGAAVPPSTDLRCDVSDVEVAGWPARLATSATVGTRQPFHEAFFIPAGAGDVEHLFVGDPDGAVFYTTALLSQSVTAPPTPATGPDTFLDGLPTEATDAWSYEDVAEGVVWNGDVVAVIEGDPLPLIGGLEGIGGPLGGDLEGCLFVLGYLEPTRIAAGPLTNGLDAPPIGLISGGRFVDPGFGCDTSPVEAVGWEWILDAEVGVGERYPFFAEITLANADLSDVQAVIIGAPGSAEEQLVRVTSIGQSVPVPN